MEDVHASMKAAGRKNLSLVDVAYVDIESSLFFEGKWQRREGEKSFGSGPSGIDLSCSEEKGSKLKFLNFEINYVIYVVFVEKYGGAICFSLNSTRGVVPRGGKRQ